MPRQTPTPSDDDIGRSEHPAFPPPPMILRGNVGPHKIEAPIWSLTLGYGVLDMYDKAARRLKVGISMMLVSTNGQWFEEEWSVIKSVAVGTQTPARPRE